MFLVWFYESKFIGLDFIAKSQFYSKIDQVWVNGESTLSNLENLIIGIPTQVMGWCIWTCVHICAESTSVQAFTGISLSNWSSVILLFGPSKSSLAQSGLYSPNTSRLYTSALQLSAANKVLVRMRRLLIQLNLKSCCFMIFRNIYS